MDKNSIMGFGLIMVLLVVYILYNQNGEEVARKKKIADSIAQVQLKPLDTLQNITDNASSATATTASNDSTLQAVPESFYTLENNDIVITFSNKGAIAQEAMLKKFKTHQQLPLYLFKGKSNKTDYAYTSAKGYMVHTLSETFAATESADKKSLTFISPNMSITYKLDDNGYMMHVDAKPIDANPNTQVALQWTSQSFLTEQNIESEKMYTQLCYNLSKEGYDYFTIKEKKTYDLNEPVKWLSFKQHYFNTTLITDGPLLQSAKVEVAPLAADTSTKLLSDFNATMQIAAGKAIQYKMFLGPNDYKLLKSYKIELEELIPLSYGVFGFVKYINKWIILPIYNFLATLFSSYGIVILLLTFIIRLLMSPFTYKSYVSSAKMKALKPELDALREKLGDDKQAFGVEQMKLFRQAGVNPLGGCLPALLQLPVFFALLSFFPHAIELRQEKFLWAKDLSTYDSIYDLPFNIPFYGDHISLFTILFVITSLLLALYSMSMTADQSNPMMKYIPFIMPVMFLGIFNKLPAALTFYYFVSNVITLGLQYVIQNYIIDPKKIHAQIEAKRKETPKENKFLQRMAEMQKQQQEKLKNKGK